MSKAIFELLNNDAANGRFEGIEGNFPFDEAVLEVMPKGTKVIAAESHGSSAWTLTGKISVILPDGTPKAYFLKLASEDHGRMMMLGEFTAITTIDAILPGRVPKPLGWGKYKAEYPETYFFIEEFIDMETGGAPEPQQFTARVAELHRTGTSPNGMFGFPVTTCDGKVPHQTGWEKSWAVFFSKLLRGVMDIDAETNGVWPELEVAAKQLFDKVIPRLLGVLQSDGRSIKPSLIHGDLWEGNVGTDMETGDIIFFDAGSYYAHNEMDIGMWRSECRQFLRAKVYIRNYLRNFEAAEPAEEFDDRNRLYSMKYNLNYSAGHPGNVTRVTAYNNMLYLIEKYAPLEGLPKYDPQKDPSVTGAGVPVIVQK